MFSTSSENAITYHPLRRSGVSTGKYFTSGSSRSASITIFAFRRRLGMFQVSMRSSSASPMADCISVIR
jgi:hypothetical protein